MLFWVTAGSDKLKVREGEVEAKALGKEERHRAASRHFIMAGVGDMEVGSWHGSVLRSKWQQRG